MGNRVAPKAFLKLQSGSGDEQIWPLEGKGTFRLGRGDGCDILLPYPWVSRQHAMIQVEENFNHNIIDLGSSNGTLLNGRRVYTPTRLSSGDLIKIGKSELVFVLENWMPTEVEGDEESEQGDETVAFFQKELATILVCDIRQFTPLSEEIGAEHVSEFLTVWTKKVAAIIQKNGGHVDKFIGDAVLAVWPSGADFITVIKALYSVLEISLWTRKIGEKIKGGDRELQVGAGVNTGEAVMSNVGGDGQRDFTIVGDVVNLTFRLEQMTSFQQVDLIIGEHTFQQLQEAESYFTRRKYTIKGKSEEVTAYYTSFKNLRDYLANWKSLLKKEMEK
ncbi:MAG: adenylate/guanylate cyclase domain-containing protein [Desulfobulbaceae bacterium]|nr:adenylate/guanylate cyclase domain-containing protein [Desulfobulbaceae bacterium]